MPNSANQLLIWPIVLSPTPTVDMLGLSIRVISLLGNWLTRVAADIQPAEPPPIIFISCGVI